VDHLGADRVALGSDFDGAVIPHAIKDASGLGLSKHCAFMDLTTRHCGSWPWRTGCWSSVSPGTRPRDAGSRQSHSGLGWNSLPREASPPRLPLRA
jgi:hypothetical protein